MALKKYDLCTIVMYASNVYVCACSYGCLQRVPKISTQRVWLKCLSPLSFSSVSLNETSMCKKLSRVSFKEGRRDTFSIASRS
jgi:hypothetical protein